MAMYIVIESRNWKHIVDKKIISVQKTQFLIMGKVYSSENYSNMFQIKLTSDAPSQRRKKWQTRECRWYVTRCDSLENKL